jgi:uncharacterized protein
MSTGPIPERVDHRKLANQAGLIEGTLPIQCFHRLGEMLVVSEGEVYLRLEFSKGDFGSTRVNGTAATEVCIICQNCMQQFRRSVSCDVALLVVSDESKLERLPEADDAIVAADKVISVAELVEDELILAMPMIPRHEEGQCPETDYAQEEIVLQETQEEQEVEEVQTTYRPFADLAKTIDKQNTK